MRRLIASLRFGLVSAVQNFVRNLAISIASVFVMFLILVMLGGVLLATHMGSQALQSEQDRASNIKIFLQDGISQASVAAFEERMAADPRVKAVRFESKDDAAQEQAQRGLGDALSVLKNNPYPASVNLDLNNINDLAAINSEVTTEPIVSHRESASTTYDPDVIPKLQRFITFVTFVGVAIMAGLGAISLVVIMVTIRTAVAIRQREIEIMKLVGATDWFVRLPFIVEGIMSGLLAAASAGILLAFAYQPAVNASRAAVAFFPFSYDAAFLVVTLGAVLATGSLLGALGSILGVRRFLTV